MLENVNADVKFQISSFRNAWRDLAGRFPDLKITYHLATTKGDDQFHPNTKLKADELILVTQEKFRNSEVSIEYYVAQSLINLARRRRKESYSLKVQKSLSAEKGYLALSRLKDFHDFLLSGPELFDDNVRDFEGANEINKEILETLKTEDQADFWWMNNGITILATRALLDGDEIAIENPQIVNGPQTSNQIIEHFNRPDLFHLKHDKRRVMVKIVSSSNDEVRDKIIKATNSQTEVMQSSLRATDPIQRDIEQRLKSVGIYYDRRKNFYKKLGKPPSKIISISLMAQITMSILLIRPDDARARPSNLIKDDKLYGKLFSKTYSIDLYRNAALLILIVDQTLANSPNLLARDRTNVRFYVVLWVAIALTGTKKTYLY